MIHKYFAEIHEKLTEIKSLIKDSIVEFRAVSSEMEIIKGKITFIDGSILDFRELTSNDEHDYRFQWINANKKMRVRWDSAPHHKELKNFPFHRHINTETIASKEVNTLLVMDEIKSEILKNIMGKI